MPSFDIVCEMNDGELDNALDQTRRDLTTRFDFKNAKVSVSYDKSTKQIELLAPDDLKLRALKQILDTRFAKRGIDGRMMKVQDPIESSKGLKLLITLKQGLEKEESKKITKVIKESSLKVQASMQDDKIRVTAKKIDDLQTTIELLRSKVQELPLQFINMRS